MRSQTGVLGMCLDDAIKRAAVDARARTDLYRYFAPDGQLLYVGVSLSALARAMQHARTAHWWDAWSSMKRERYASRADALAAEASAIVHEHPAFNIAGTSPNLFAPRGL
jgi:hypothetical protein